MRLATLAWPVEPMRGPDDYAAKLDHWAAEAKHAGADLLHMPEYACVELGAALAGNALDAAAELRAMVGAADAILAAMRATALRHAIWLQPGTLPMAADGQRIVNRAPLIAPDGRMAFQDKRMMTRFETERWGISAGQPPQVFDTPWGRIGIAICYDAEFPKLVRAQVEAGAWLVLVPTCTDTLYGYQRVRIGARARAMENQCFVALAPTVGGFAASVALDENRGAAGVFGPVDRGFAEDGVVAEAGLDQPGLILTTLDPARLHAVRADGAVRNHADWPREPVPRPEPAVFA